MNSHRYFENRDCKYYPCHDMPKGEGVNCLFCYCPLYGFENCPGNHTYVERKGKMIKTCVNCTFPHEKKNFDLITKLIRERS